MNCYAVQIETVLRRPVEPGLSSVTLNYCPMARFVSLLPWNRVERLTLQLAARTLLASPRTWRFPAAGRLRSASEAP
jgi:hypothetical protein